MAGLTFVLNEWPFHDLAGENGPAARAETLAALDAVRSSTDRIAVLYGGAWLQKLYDFVRDSARDSRLRSAAKLLRTFVYDTRHCVLVHPDPAAQIPEPLASAMPADDRYLAETFLAARADRIVTTDARLMQIVREQQAIRIQHRNEFIIEVRGSP